MFQGNFKGVLRKFKGVSRNNEVCLIGVLSGFQVYIKEVQRVLQGSFKGTYQENIKRAFMGVLRMFHRHFALQFCCCLALIAATRAEGGLVFLETV